MVLLRTRHRVERIQEISSLRIKMRELELGLEEGMANWRDKSKIVGVKGELERAADEDSVRAMEARKEMKEKLARKERMMMWEMEAEERGLWKKDKLQEMKAKLDEDREEWKEREARSDISQEEEDEEEESESDDEEAAQRGVDPEIMRQLWLELSAQ